MSEQHIASIVLAAGRSTRMRGQRSKLLHEVAGLPIIGRVARLLRGLALSQNLFIVSHQKDAVMEAIRVELPTAIAVNQGEPLGTGHAVRVGLGALSKPITDVLVLAGDVPLLRDETLRHLLEIHATSGALVSLLTFHTSNPEGYGRVIRDSKGCVQEIVESQECTPEQAKIQECNAGVYVFRRAFLEQEIHHLRNNNSKGELYLTDLVACAYGKIPAAAWNVDEHEVMGVNTASELARANTLANANIVRRHLRAGVVFLFPETVEIHEDVEIAPGAIIEAFVSLRGKTRIGTSTRISMGALLQNANIEDDVSILPYTLVDSSRIETGARVGPFARIRPDSVVGKNAHVGNFVELKKTVLHAGVKANHLSYLGDAEVGEGSNIGAGTITCNYDGKNKYTTIIGAGVFVGSDSQLIAPVHVGDGAYIGTGTTVFSDVPAQALAINPRRQDHRLNWVAPYARTKNDEQKNNHNNK